MLAFSFGVGTLGSVALAPGPMGKQVEHFVLDPKTRVNEIPVVVEGMLWEPTSHHCDF